jgi:hypothetical protein
MGENEAVGFWNPGRAPRRPMQAPQQTRRSFVRNQMVGSERVRRMVRAGLLGRPYLACPARLSKELCLQCERRAILLRALGRLCGHPTTLWSRTNVTISRRPFSVWRVSPADVVRIERLTRTGEMLVTF